MIAGKSRFNSVFLSSSPLLIAYEIDAHVSITSCERMISLISHQETGVGAPKFCTKQNFPKEKGVNKLFCFIFKNLICLKKSYFFGVSYRVIFDFRYRHPIYIPSLLYAFFWGGE